MPRDWLDQPSAWASGPLSYHSLQDRTRLGGGVDSRRAALWRHWPATIAIDGSRSNSSMSAANAREPRVSFIVEPSRIRRIRHNCLIVAIVDGVIAKLRRMGGSRYMSSWCVIVRNGI